MTTATADTRMPGAEANDLTGYDVSTGGDIDGDGLDEMIIGAMWAGGSSNPGEIYLFFGLSAPPATVALADADALWTGEPNETAGHGLTFAGDLDGDGLADVVTGAPGRDTPVINGGGAYVLLDPGAGGAMSDGGVIVVPESADDAVGEAVIRAGDLDGDGFDDLVIGARGDDDGAEEGGAAYVILGPLGAGSLALASADAKLTGDTLRGYAGNALAAGDANGDGLGDLLIGSREYTVVSPFVALVHGPFAGSRSISTAEAVFEGVDREGLGASLTFWGDLDGDGAQEFAVGSPYLADGANTRAGAVHVFDGNVTGTIGASDALGVFVGSGVDAYLGMTVAPAGDYDGDGLPDLLIGAFGEGNGTAYVVPGG